MSSVNSINSVYRSLVPLMQLALLLWLLLLESMSDIPWLSLFGLLLWMRTASFGGKLASAMVVSVILSAVYTTSLALVTLLFLVICLLVEELGYRLSQSLRLHVIAVLVGGITLGIVIGFHWTAVAIALLVVKLLLVSIGTVWWRQRQTTWVKRARFRLGL